MFKSSSQFDSQYLRQHTPAVTSSSVDSLDSAYFTLAAPNPPSYIAGGTPHPSIPGFSPVESPPPYLNAAYPPASPLKPAAPSASTDSMMMAQRDMGYGYMPSPMHNPLQYGPTGPSYSSLGPLPAYYSEPPPQQQQQQQPPQQPPQHHQRSYSGSSRPSLSVLDYQSLGGSGDTSTNDLALSRKRRRTSEHEARRLNKMRVRRGQASSLLEQKNDDGSPTMSGPVDLYPVASTPTSYVPERPAMPSPYREYGDISPQHAQYSPSFHQPSYSMGPLNPGSLAPPLLPGTNSGYNPGRSSPIIHGPLPPASNVPQHPEPIVVGGGREKPQCWDHGCNGREFSTFSNLLRHQREKSGSASKSYCPHCGAEFTRTTARNGHVEQGKCKTRKTSDASNPPRP